MLPQPPQSGLALMLIGLPGSGKSSLAGQVLARGPHWRLLSTDALREQLFGQAAIQGPWVAIEQALDQQLRLAWLARRPVILDATQARRRHRRRALAQLVQAGYGAVWGLWLREPLGRCCQRNRGRDRQVPQEIMRSMHRSLEATPPRLDEGFSQLWISHGLGISHGLDPLGTGEMATSASQNAPRRYWLRSRPGPREEHKSAAPPMGEAELLAILEAAPFSQPVRWGSLQRRYPSRDPATPGGAG